MRKFCVMTISLLVLAGFSGFARGQQNAPVHLSRQPDPDAVSDSFYTYDPNPRASGRSNSEGPVLKKGFLAPATADRQSLTQFLRLSHTGLFRLLPREVYDSQYTHATSPVKIRGGGAYYSFVDLTHEYGYGSDIELQHNLVSVGFAGADYGMLTMLGDTPLAQLSAKDPRVHFIASYQPPASERQARTEAQRFGFPGGVTIDGQIYQSTLPLLENSTYLLRSIAYGRSDVLVAFRVIRREPDGSAVIAWKLLKRFWAPRLKAK
jgi:hypothetical protein